MTRLSSITILSAALACLLSGCGSADEGGLECGDDGEYVETDVARYCAYIVVVGGFDCPPQLAHRIDFPDGAVVCSDAPGDREDLPEEVCRHLGDRCGTSLGDGGRVWMAEACATELSSRHAGEPCSGDFVCHGDCPCGSETIRCVSGVLEAEGECVDCAVACGSEACGPTEICVQPCRCGPAPACEPLGDGGSCPAGTVDCTTGTGTPGCATDCSPPPPYCSALPGACDPTTTCGCFESDPCSSGSCDDMWSFDGPAGTLECVCL